MGLPPKRHSGPTDAARARRRLPLRRGLGTALAVAGALLALQVAAAVRPGLGRADAETSAAGEPGGALTGRSGSVGEALAQAAKRSGALDSVAGRRPRHPLLLARVRPGHSVVLRRRPGAQGATRLGARTEWGSPRLLAVTAVRGRWLGVASVARPDGGLAWVRRDRSLTLAPAGVTLEVDLSRRRLELWRGSRRLRRLRISIGRPAAPTPTGHFAVTDKLDGRRFGPYYGCCVLALSGTQSHLPPGWRGGDRIAIHGTDANGAIGTASTAGCLRAADADLRALMRRVPLGTPVTIRR